MVETMLTGLVDEFNRYRLIGERALAQIPDSGLDLVPAPDGNSAGMLVCHLSGNLTSRFSDFLTSDGEKPSRDRDGEFEDQSYSRAEITAMWATGWNTLENALGELTDNDLARLVTIRQQSLTVHAALCRSLAHVAYHVGQIVLIARQQASTSWQWISIPKGESQSYNTAPYLEQRPR